MYFHILGTGNIACLLAVNLKKAGHTVSLLTRNEQTTEQNNTKKIIFDVLTKKYKVDLNIEQSKLLKKKISVLIVATKAYDVSKAIQSILHSIADDCLIVLTQNGLGLEEEIKKILPNQQTISIVTTCGVHNIGKHYFKQVNEGRLSIGSREHGITENNMIAQKLLGLSFSLHSKWSNNIIADQWYKLSSNCIINPLTAIHKCPNGDLLKHTKIKKEIKALSNEIEKIMNALKIPNSKVSVYESTCHLIKSTENNFSSMYQDIKNKKRTEIDYLNGHICKVAQELGLNAKHNIIIYEKIKTIEANY